MLNIFNKHPHSDNTTDKNTKPDGPKLKKFGSKPANKSRKKGKSLVGALKLKGAAPSMILDDLQSAVENKDGYVAKVKGGFRVIVLTDDDLEEIGITKKNPVLGSMGSSLHSNNMLSATTLADRDAGNLVIIPTLDSLNSMDEYDELRNFENYRIAIFPEDASDEDPDVKVTFTGELVSFDDMRTADVAPASIVNDGIEKNPVQDDFDTEGKPDDFNNEDTPNGGVDEDIEEDDTDDEDVEVTEDESLNLGDDSKVLPFDGSDVEEDDDSDEDDEDDTDVSEDDEELVPAEPDVVTDENSDEPVTSEEFTSQFTKLEDKVITGKDLVVTVDNSGINDLLADIKAPELIPPENNELLTQSTQSQYNDGNSILKQLTSIEIAKLKSLYSDQLNKVVKSLVDSVSLNDKNNRYGKIRDAITEAYNKDVAEIDAKADAQAEVYDSEYEASKKDFIETAKRQAAEDYDRRNKQNLEAKKEQYRLTLSAKAHDTRINLMANLSDDRQGYVDSKIYELQSMVLDAVTKAKSDLDAQIIDTTTKISDGITEYQHGQYQNELKRINVLDESQRQHSEADKVRDEYERKLEELHEQLKLKDQAIREVQSESNDKIEKINLQSKEAIDNLKHTITIQGDLISKQTSMINQINIHPDLLDKNFSNKRVSEENLNL